MLRSLAICSVALGAIGLSSAAFAEPARSQATDFSSQQKKKVAPVVQPQRGRAPPANVNLKPKIQQQKIGGPGGSQFKKVGGPGGGSPQFKKVGGPGSGSPQFKKIGGPGSGSPQFKKIGGPGGPVVNPQVQKLGVTKFAPLKAGPGKVTPVALKPGNFQVVKLGGNKLAPKWVGPKKIYWGGKWKTFIPLAALGAVVIGGSYYYADSYLTVARPYCEGITPDGCRLNWQRVNFEDGDSEWQCVQFCPRPGAPPPARTVALVAPPPMQGTCELSIYSEPNFTGTNATSADEQPRLAELGWANQIASVKIASGTWDFFTEPDFTGEVVRFGPGQYPDLGPDWTRKAASFMCVQP
jgi:hypothetical protein